MRKVLNGGGLNQLTTSVEFNCPAVERATQLGCLKIHVSQTTELNHSRGRGIEKLLTSRGTEEGSKKEPQAERLLGTPVNQ